MGRDLHSSPKEVHINLPQREGAVHAFKAGLGLSIIFKVLDCAPPSIIFMAERSLGSKNLPNPGSACLFGPSLHGLRVNMSKNAGYISKCVNTFKCEQSLMNTPLWLLKFEFSSNIMNIQ